MSELVTLVDSRIEQGVMSITLQRADKKNALTTEMYQTLRELLRSAEADSQVRVVLFQGAGGNFSSGNDLKDFLNHPPQDERAPVFQFLLAASQFSKPIVAAVDGVAVGIGTTLLLHCDLVYSAENTRFQLPFINLGVCPEAASSLLLPQRLGHVRAAQLLLLGDMFNAAQALEWGLINAILPSAELHTHALSVCQQLAQKAPNALRLTKALLKQTQATEVRERIVQEARSFADCLRKPEAKEALDAVLNKRPADFSNCTSTV